MAPGLTTGLPPAGIAAVSLLALAPGNSSRKLRRPSLSRACQMVSETQSWCAGGLPDAVRERYCVPGGAPVIMLMKSMLIQQLT